MTETAKPATIDLPKARELLAKAVETQGRDFVYKSAAAFGLCTYFPQTWRRIADDDVRRKTGCLVGVALKLHGHDVSQLGGSIGEVRRQNPDWMTEAACQYFQVAQNEQDLGAPWGEAHDRAEEHAAEGTLHEVYI